MASVIRQKAVTVLNTANLHNFRKSIVVGTPNLRTWVKRSGLKMASPLSSTARSGPVLPPSAPSRLGADRPAAWLSRLVGIYLTFALI